MKKFYDRGGSVIVPQAPEEPDERIDKMTGLPYDLQAGGAFVDEEDRLGFSAAGLVTFIKRLTRGVDEVVADTRPVTRFEADQGSKDTIRNFREQEPQSFIDPNSFYYSTSKVKIDNEGKFLKHLDEEENLDLGMFKNADIEEQDNIINRFYSANPSNKAMDIKVYREPDQRYWKAKQETETKLNAEVEDEFNNIPVDDVSLVQKYTDDIPKVSDKPVEPSTLTKEEFLKDSVEKSPQFNGSFFSGIRYDNPLSTRIPRELGMHIGTKGQAENILLRGTHPTAENMIERIATQYYMGQGMSEAAAQVAVLEKGVPDSIYDDLIKELNLSVPTGVEPSLQKGFINVKNPLILDTDMINWNPSKFLGGFDPKGKIKLAEQAQSFVDALNAQVKLRPAQFTKIVDDAAKQINTILRKKDKNSGKLLNSVYDHHINQLTKTMLEDLGFDSIKYKNLGELARVSEKKAGGNSYILFRDNQFVTDFKPSLYERPKGTLRETIPEVQKAYDDLKAGTITSGEYDRIVNNTVYPYESVPTPETNEAMSNALRVGQRDKINATFEEGQRLGIRLDINAYLKEEPDKAWVPTIHVGRKAMGHQATAAIKNADFTMPIGNTVSNKKSGAEFAQEVMEGNAKHPFAQIEGNYVNRTTEENYRLAQEALNSDEWIQVGFDPRRHSFFYDRVTGQPVATAEEVIQVGPLVLAKKATYADRSLYPYATGGKVLGSLQRTRKAEGGGFFGMLDRAVKKGAKFLGFDDDRQIEITADAVDLTNQIAPSNQRVGVKRLVPEDVTVQGPPDEDTLPTKRVVREYKMTTDELRNSDRNRDQIKIDGDEEVFDIVNHALFGYESAEKPFTAFSGQAKEVYQGVQKAVKGQEWRTELKDMWNNSWGIKQREQGLSRPEFDMALAQAIMNTKNKLKRGETLRMGEDIVLNALDLAQREQRNTGGKILGSLHRSMYK